MNTIIKTTLLAFAVLVMGGHFASCTAQTGSQDNSVNSVLCKENLKILHIGNSLTFDAVSYLPLIIESTGADVSDLCIYRTMLSGGSFLDWYNVYNDRNILDYQIEKVCGGLAPGEITGSAKARDGSLLRKALTDVKWDIIFIQQASTYSPYYEQWGGNGEGGYLNELLGVIRHLQPDATIGMVLVHSSASTFRANAEHSSLERWKLIVSSVEKCCADYGIEIVLPYGTAVQNLRASSLNNELDLTCDGLHCELVLARYVASCCYFQSIIAPRTGISVLSDHTRINKNFVTANSPMISVDDQTAPIAQKAAIMAVEDWHHCYNPEAPDPEKIVGDVNADKTVDVADIATVISVMADKSGNLSRQEADVNGDGVVDVADIAAIIIILSSTGSTER